MIICPTSSWAFYMWQKPGPWLSIKMTSCQYRKSHCGDTLNWKCHHFVINFITDCTGSCHFDKFSISSKWQHFRFSVRQSKDHLISTKGFPILERLHLYIELNPWYAYILWRPFHIWPSFSKIKQTPIAPPWRWGEKCHSDGLVQDCSISIALSM